MQHRFLFYLAGCAISHSPFLHFARLKINEKFGAHKYYYNAFTISIARVQYVHGVSVKFELTSSRKYLPLLRRILNCILGIFICLRMVVSGVSEHFSPRPGIRVEEYPFLNTNPLTSHLMLKVTIKGRNTV